MKIGCESPDEVRVLLVDGLMHFQTPRPMAVPVRRSLMATNLAASLQRNSRGIFSNCSARSQP